MTRRVYEAGRTCVTAVKGDSGMALISSETVGIHRRAVKGGSGMELISPEAVRIQCDLRPVGAILEIGIYERPGAPPGP